MSGLGLTMRWPRRIGLFAAVCAVGALTMSTQASGQQADPGGSLLTVGVDATDAGLTHATYSLLVANHGTAPATGVVLTNPVPARTTFSGTDRPPLDSSACKPGAPATTQCRWALGEIAPGASATVTVSYALEQSEAAYPATNSSSFSNTASVQLANAAPAGTDPADTDSSLVRTSHLLDQDAYVDDALPEMNFGFCNQLLVRRDNSQTAFVDNDAVSTAFGEDVNERNSGLAGVERFGGAELRATAASASPSVAGEPIPVAVHKVVSRDWTEGAGGCAGAPGGGQDVRSAARPQSEASPTASAPVAGSGPVRWNVSAALDTREERDEFSGFELRSEGSIGPAGDRIAFDSSDGTPAPQPADRPRLVTVSIRMEQDRCIDSDPEVSSGPSDREQRIDAYVTDGAPMPDGSSPRISNPSGDADGCRGTPVPGAPVGWDLDDDSPDAYISSLAGVAVPREVGSAGDAGPNRGATRTDANGRTFGAIRLGGPYSDGANAGDNRVAAIVLDEHHNGKDQDPSITQHGESGVCEPGELENDHWLDKLRGTQCGGTGEVAREDDVNVAWSPAPPPPPTSAQPAPPSAPPDQLGAPSSRQVSLWATPQHVRPGGDSVLQGELDSSVASCADGGELIRLFSRASGAGTYEDFANTATDAEGRFALPVDVEQSTDYIAIASGHDECAATASQPTSVLAAAEVIARPSAKKVDRGERVKIRGRVQPDPDASEVVLQRRAGRRWSDVAIRRLDTGSEFKFTIRASWAGGREFRIRWESLDEDRLLDLSRALEIRTVGARPGGRK